MVAVASDNSFRDEAVEVSGKLDVDGEEAMDEEEFNLGLDMAGTVL